MDCCHKFEVPTLPIVGYTIEIYCTSTNPHADENLNNNGRHFRRKRWRISKFIRGHRTKNWSTFLVRKYVKVKMKVKEEQARRRRHLSLGLLQKRRKVKSRSRLAKVKVKLKEPGRKSSAIGLKMKPKNRTLRRRLRRPILVVSHQRCWYYQCHSCGSKFQVLADLNRHRFSYECVILEQNDKEQKQKQPIPVPVFPPNDILLIMSLSPTPTSDDNELNQPESEDTFPPAPAPGPEHEEQEEEEEQPEIIDSALLPLPESDQQLLLLPVPDIDIDQGHQISKEEQTLPAPPTLLQCSKSVSVIPPNDSSLIISPTRVRDDNEFNPSAEVTFLTGPPGPEREEEEEVEQPEIIVPDLPESTADQLLLRLKIDQDQQIIAEEEEEAQTLLQAQSVTPPPLPPPKKRRPKKKAKPSPAPAPASANPAAGTAGSQKLVCPYCDKQIHGSGNFAIHVRSHTNEKPFSCEYCDRRFNARKNLLVHLKIHLNDRPYGCSYCSRRFISKTLWAAHERSHTGETPYVCPDCGKKCNSTRTLNLHLVVHTDVKPYQCDECDYKGSRPGDLRQHQYIRHALKKETDLEHSKPHLCPICKRRFTIKTNLNIHMKGHDPSTFICHICERKYTTANGLKHHMRIIHGMVMVKMNLPPPSRVPPVKPAVQQEVEDEESAAAAEQKYRCKFCNKKYRSGNGLKYHLIAIHPGRTGGDKSPEAPIINYFTTDPLEGTEKLCEISQLTPTTAPPPTSAKVKAKEPRKTEIFIFEHIVEEDEDSFAAYLQKNGFSDKDYSEILPVPEVPVVRARTDKKPSRSPPAVAAVPVIKGLSNAEHLAAATAAGGQGLQGQEEEFILS